MVDNAGLGKRVALVIGNSSYAHQAQLPNPRNDASDIASTLKRIGFAVRLDIDVTREGLLKDVTDFARDVEGSDAALFFYAGHGLQVDGVNYIVPTDASIEREADVAFSAQKLDPILEMMMRTSNASFVILDACRNNPFTRSLRRSMGTSRGTAVGEGLAIVRLRAEGEALIAYSTQPDNVAEDGTGRNSPYTDALLRNIELPGLSIEEALKRVIRDVKTATESEQIPWYTSSLSQDFKFIPGIAPRVDSGGAQHPWQLLKDTPNPNLIRSFINNFPNDFYVADAKQRLGELEVGGWNTIRNSQTLPNLEAFLSQFPDGHYAKDAKQKLVMQRRLAIGSLAGLALVTGLISGLSTPGSTFLNRGYIISGDHELILWWNVGVFLFGCAIAFGLSRWWPQAWKAILSLIGLTLFGWILAHLGYQIMARLAGLSVTDLDALRVRGNVPPEGQPIATSYEFVMRMLITAAACAIGAAVTMLGAAITSARLRRTNVWVVAVFGTMLAAVLAIILKAYWPRGVVPLTALFVMWQVWIAACIAWAYTTDVESDRPTK